MSNLVLMDDYNSIERFEVLTIFLKFLKRFSGFFSNLFKIVLIVN